MPPGVATLIVNPASGRAAAFNKQRAAIDQRLCDAGYEPHLIETSPTSGSTLVLAREATAQSAADRLPMHPASGSVEARGL
jgi:diacylglycerol kinase family enzyme